MFKYSRHIVGLALLTITFPSLSASRYLIIGTRNLARTATEQLLKKGSSVTVFAWDKEKTEKMYGASKKLTVVQGAVEKDTDKLCEAAEKATHIFFAPHYPYAIWSKNMPRATRNVIKAAEQNKATILFPSKVYSLGKQDGAMNEMTVAKPCSEQGKTFREMETLLQEAGEKGKCKVIVVRHAHAFGPHIIDGLMDRAFKNALNGKPMQWVYRTDVDYQVAYAPDIVDAMLAVAQLKIKSSFSLFHFAGETIKVNNWLKDISTAAGNKTFSTSLDSWLTVKFLAPFQTDAQACRDIFYMFEQPVVLASTLLEKTVKLANTPMQEAIKETLVSYVK